LFKFPPTGTAHIQQSAEKAREKMQVRQIT